MKKFFRSVLPSALAVLLSVFLLAGCAAPVTMAPMGNSAEIEAERQKQIGLVLKSKVEEQKRLDRLAHPILVSNAALCGRDVAPMFGFSVWNQALIPAAYRAAARAGYGLSDQLQVLNVVPNSVAGRTGLKDGDVIVSVGGTPLPPGREAARVFDREAGVLASSGQKKLSMRVKRGEKLLDVTLPSEKGCDFPVVLEEGDDVNAFADGDSIHIHRGMIRFAENDTELALVIAHELAHNAMNHVGKQMQNQAVGAIGGALLDVLAGTAGDFARMGAQLAGSTHSVAFEQEADYIGMYFMARAGYKTEGVADFWRRMAVQDSRAITARYTHPSSPERFIAIEKAHAEIAAKRARGQTLQPNMKPKS